MTLLNVGIVFALTLGIPGSMLNMLLTEYEYIFLTEDEVSTSSEQANDSAAESDKEDITEREELEKPIPRFLTILKQGDDKRSNRNSMMFLSGAPNAIKHIEKNLDSKWFEVLWLSILGYLLTYNFAQLSNQRYCLMMRNYLTLNLSVKAKKQ